METSERPQSLGRRALLAGAAGALAAGAAGPLAGPVQAAPADRAEDISSRKAARRLETIARQLERVDNRLADLASVLIDPSDPDVNPPDDKPAICAALDEIMSASTSIGATADELLRSLECLDRA